MNPLIVKNVYKCDWTILYFFEIITKEQPFSPFKYSLVTLFLDNWTEQSYSFTIKYFCSSKKKSVCYLSFSNIRVPLYKIFHDFLLNFYSKLKSVAVGICKLCTSEKKTDSFIELNPTNSIKPLLVKNISNLLQIVRIFKNSQSRGRKINHVMVRACVFFYSVTILEISTQLNRFHGI